MIDCGGRWLLFILLLCIPSLILSERLGKDLRSTFSCYNNLLDIQCKGNEVIVFEQARYGRNDTEIATACKTHFQRNCDVDAHFTMNRLCAGKPTCALLVNTRLFGDPCGYNEFLTVTYKCVLEKEIHTQCKAVPNGPYIDHGYIASPNYPEKYYLDADCLWSLAVQPRQTIRITIFDFELDVKKGGQCNDYVEIMSGSRTYFKDCGGLGKQELTVDANNALLRFHVSPNSLTQRGFHIYFEAVGPGCPDIKLDGNGTVFYKMEKDTLLANISCPLGFVLADTAKPVKVVSCLEDFGPEAVWSDIIEPCIVFVPTTTTLATTPQAFTTTELLAEQNSVASSGSIIGIILGVVSAFLLILLLLVLSLYLHRSCKENMRRKRAERKLDEMRVVFNNLQENALNDENIQHVIDTSFSSFGKSNTNPRRAGKRPVKKTQNYEDEWQGRNLLSHPTYLDEDEDGDPYTKDTPIKPDDFYHGGSRRSSMRGKYSLARSRDSHLESPVIDFDEQDIYRYENPRTLRSPPPPQPVPVNRRGRSRSGVWEGRKRSPTPQPKLTQEKRLMTMSAPDLLECLSDSDCSSNTSGYEGSVTMTARGYARYDSLRGRTHDPHGRSTRSNNTGAIQPHRALKSLSRSNSRNKIRC